MNIALQAAACVVIGVLSLGSMASRVQAQAPPNDNFENATVLPSTDSVQIAGTTLGSTVQPGEGQALSGRTVWYAWTAPSSGIAELSAVAPTNPLRGTVVLGDDLLLVQAIAAGVMTSSPVAFYAIEGTTYRIQVSDYVPGYINYQGFSFELGLAIANPIPAKTLYVQPGVNDNFDSPLVLTKTKSNFVQYMAETTLEPFEASVLASAGIQVSDGDGSTWILWTPAKSGTAEFSATTVGGQNVALLEGKGTTLASFKVKKADFGGVTFNCKAGKSYRLWIVASQEAQVLATLRVTSN